MNNFTTLPLHPFPLANGTNPETRRDQIRAAWAPPRSPGLTLRGALGPAPVHSPTAPATPGSERASTPSSTFRLWGLGDEVPDAQGGRAARLRVAAQRSPFTDVDLRRPAPYSGRRPGPFPTRMTTPHPPPTLPGLPTPTPPGEGPTSPKPRTASGCNQALRDPRREPPPMEPRGGLENQGGEDGR